VGIHDLLDRARATDDPAAPAVTVPDDASELVPDDVLPPDPKPGKRTARARAPRPAASATKATSAQRKQVEDSVQLLLTLVGGGISMRDRVCGPAISAQAEAVAKAATPIICRNPAMLVWFTGGAGLMDVIGLLMAFQPVIATVWSHHVTKSTVHDGHQGHEGVPVDYSAFAAPSI
jgi:hypothetical protein